LEFFDREALREIYSPETFAKVRRIQLTTGKRT
jgi:hypothetical protein